MPIEKDIEDLGKFLMTTPMYTHREIIMKYYMIFIVAAIFILSITAFVLFFTSSDEDLPPQLPSSRGSYFMYGFIGLVTAVLLSYYIPPMITAFIFGVPFIFGLIAIGTAARQQQAAIIVEVYGPK